LHKDSDFLKITKCRLSGMAFVKGLEREEIMLLPPAVDDFICRESPTRAIDVFVDSLDMNALGFCVRDEFAQGRSSYHPATLLKLYLWGYLNRTRSSRQLEEASRSNLNVIWLTGNLRPDHTTISRFRKGQAPALAKIFGHFTTICLQPGLFGRQNQGKFATLLQESEENQSGQVNLTGSGLPPTPQTRPNHHRLQRPDRS
jgi:transposase